MDLIVNRKKKKVFAAMSGGVDSSVAAALLCKSGYDVAGVFMKNWTASIPGIVSCPWEEDERDARFVASVLNIPFYTLDFEKDYKSKVVDYMIEEYTKGRTPNPDVMCNYQIKFGLFLKTCLELGASYIAMGHYAQVFSTGLINKTYHLAKGTDIEKDQSYFLWTLTQKELPYVIFPVGKFNKHQVRKMAQEMKLPTYNKKDSQGICFIGKLDVNNFLKQYIPINKGGIIDRNGHVLGEHEGLSFYTIGQREGLKIGGTGPYYVISKDFKNNNLIVCRQSEIEKFLLKKSLIVTNVNWISGCEPDLKRKNMEAAIRYHAPTVSVSLKKLNKNNIEENKYFSANKFGPYRAVFDKNQPAITPGQSIVFYRGEEMLGGGIIELDTA